MFEVDLPLYIKDSYLDIVQSTDSNHLPVRSFFFSWPGFSLSTLVSSYTAKAFRQVNCHLIKLILSCVNVLRLQAPLGQGLM
ncbi:hypothetical protein XENTR_v10000630 [Xenopus tropicalis]|nr:hypothetical protein XENTR_v10000630 [Xenopus tropicalis]